MQFTRQDVDLGIADGLSRATTLFGPSVAPYTTQELSAQIRSVLEQWPQQANSDFVRLVSDLTTTAAFARNWNQEPKLGNEDITAFVSVLSWFLNSFKHK